MPTDQNPMPIAERIVTVKTRSKTVRCLVELLPDWITPNLVTAFRGALAIPVFFALHAGRYGLALAIFAAAMSLDAVDGAIAHVKNMGSVVGAFIDPLADKLLVYGALLALWDALPAWIAVLLGGSLLFAAGITLVRVARLVRARRVSAPELARTVAAKTAGKVKTMFDVLAVACIMAGLAGGSDATVDAGGVLIVIGSLLSGAIHFSRSSR